MSTFFQWLVDFFRGITPWVIVTPWELAVRIRFGKYLRPVGPGVHFKIPHFDEFLIVNTRLRIAVTQLQTVSTKDRFTVSLAASIGFKVINPLESFRKFQDPTATIGAYATTLLTQYILTRELNEIVIEELRASMMTNIQDFCCGMQFEFIAITDFAVVKTFRLLQEQGRNGVWGGSEPPSNGGRRIY